MAALANLPMGWVFETPRRFRDDLILMATGPAGDEVETSGGTAGEAWGAMARELAARGRGRMLPMADIRPGASRHL